MFKKVFKIIFQSHGFTTKEIYFPNVMFNDRDVDKLMSTMKEIPYRREGIFFDDSLKRIFIQENATDTEEWVLVDVDSEIDGILTEMNERSYEARKRELQKKYKL